MATESLRRRPDVLPYLFSRSVSSSPSTATQLAAWSGHPTPVPLELVGVDRQDLDGIANDLLCLTKMNWNSARSAAGLPITLSFARKVGGIMAELPPGVTPHPSFRYYM